MNNRQDLNDIGERIRDAVQDAIATGDFGQINIIVSNTVGGAMDEVRRQVSQAHDRINRPLEKEGQKTVKAEENGRQDYASRYRAKTPRYPRTPRYPGQEQGGQSTREHRSPSETAAYRSRNTALRNFFSPNGRVAGILYTVFGSIGLGIFGLTALGALTAFLTTDSVGGVAVAVAVIFVLLTAGSAIMLGKGCGLQARLNRARRYLKLARENMYIRLEDLAARTGQSVRKVRRDVRRMLQIGIFPEGHMDTDETVLVLNDETWDRYLAEQKEYLEKQRLEDAGRQEAVGEQPEEGKDLTAEEQIERDGHAYMNRLRELNIQIPGEIVSNKLYQLDYLLQRIFMVLKEHPEKCPQMRKFMDYYLPTTVKLVESYADFDRAGVQGEHIRTAKAEIEKTMDTINQAFEKLLDDMYQDAAFEAAADAKVLKTLLAQDGYMKSDFSMNTEKEGENYESGT